MTRLRQSRPKYSFDRRSRRLKQKAFGFSQDFLDFMMGDYLEERKELPQERDCFDDW